jgi:hypothetical protein
MKLRVKGEYQFNKSYNIKMLKWLCDSDITKKEIETWFKKTLVPSLMNLTKNKLKEDPVLGPDWYIRVPTWSDIMDDDDMDYVIKSCAYNCEPPIPVQGFLKEKKACIYSFWSAGNLPFDKIIIWEFQLNHLDPVDAHRWIDNQRDTFGKEYHINGMEEFENDNPVNLNNVQAAIQDEADNSDSERLFFTESVLKSRFFYLKIH